VTGLTLSFAGLRVLTDVSLAVRAGSLFSIIGPNGAGKSSLFNCISGLYRPEAGSILFRDDRGAGADGRGSRELVGERADRIAAAGVGRMFQNIALFENLTVLENLLVGRHHRMRYGWVSACLRTPAMMREEIEHRRAVEELIDLLQLSRYRNLPVSLLPYGVLKRVELGRALATEPRLLLLDEPAAGLNQEEREDMARYILEAQQHLGITQILIEHDLGFVMDLSDEVLAMNFGTVIAHGAPAAVGRHPEVRRAYLGAAEAAEP
jgi:branched-chain amino acid transport system ATP-binding protein